MKIKRYYIVRFAWMLLAMLSLTGCTEEVLSVFSSNNEIKAGDPVLFTTYMPVKPVTRAMTEEQFKARMDSFNQVQADYEFTVEMYQKPETEQTAPTLLGSATYLPIKTYTIEDDVKKDSTYAADGTLKAKAEQDSLYWPGNAKKYGFKAWANKGTLQKDQSTADKLFAQDYIEGYGFEPLWDTDETKRDKEDELNYRTSKQWYQANQTTMGMTPASLVPGGTPTSDFYKKIPLYLKHQRAKITIILKAGEGVERTALNFAKAETNISTKICSYASSTPDSIQPYAEETSIDYGTSTEDMNVGTTQYTAIVEPHNYLAGATTDKIAEIKLSGQRFSFYAGNDDQYKDYSDENATDHATAVTHMNGYNLTAGKHLKITATLGRESRKILITAYVVDWDEAVTTSVVDDYGQAGDPIQIKNRAELLAFLQDSKKNKAGNVAIIVPNSINLEKDEAWPQNLDLNCTLNMAGSTFYTTQRVFNNITASGNLVNGTIGVGNSSTTTTSVTASVAQTNHGTIERVNIVTKDASGNDALAKATQAGLVVTNTGTIIGCTSELPVEGSSGYVGGIASTSVYSSESGNTMPVIDRCTVNARVSGTGETKGGGIVGSAVGRVTNNTFEYGITQSQNADNFKNIIQTKDAETGVTDKHALRAYSNSWPTVAHNNNQNEVPETNTNIRTDLYNAVIDCQSELDAVLKSSTYNTTGQRVLIADDFAVTGWILGKKDDQLSGSNVGNVFFELNGNNKTITTDGMLFTNIQNHVYDMTVVLSKDLIASKTDDNNVTTGGEAIAPFAYAVYGGTGDYKGRISNIKVKGGNYRIQAENPGGVVVWAYKGAVVEDCQCTAKIYVWSRAASNVYAGGIVACAADATITRCVFHDADNTLIQNFADTYNATPVTEGTATTTYYYGGILGGTVPKMLASNISETPNVLITDCSSKFNAVAETTPSQKGSIVGYGVYPDSNNNNTLVNGIKDGCQGNWWNSSSTGIGTWDSSKTAEQIIGKRNAVEPTFESY